ncbi:myotubularin-related protein 9 isoform X1 [Tribolium castaneum]|uniref:Myotubularin-related protein 9-like Protein n=1 Tax=Tribolium castaneum TaxID=7070 RepID=D6WMP8_TRICA|nr:PREDICTED: myotubularin-related protein 9 isoform X1 [Tribolium castaneum]EFA03795.1 Myotubularin-related protein 9-like Protein [Tribolium castaneum]|eukprot:XP_970048.1 PREDICTED: myotubularin-related protein 9 isoform X1 [Tribolium castaneum]
MEFAELIATPKLDGVILHCPFHEPIDGTLCVTGHHLILSSRKEDVQELWLLHQCIDSIEKKQNSNNSNQNGGSLILKCKDFRILQLDISNSDELLNVYASIDRLSNLDRPESLYPFFYRPMYNILEDGHTLFKLESEYAKLLASEEWRISHINKNYTVCPTYSASVIVPKSIDDDVIVASASFRDGGRFPLLSYRHDNGAILLRSSQPLLNNNNRRSRADEKILNVILGSGKKGYIIDTRSTNYVSHCKGKGGGTEPDAHYTQWKRVHKPLDKIAKCDGSLIDSLAKLLDACNDTNCSFDKWMSRLESSNWLSFVQNSLNAACLVAQCLDQDGASVLVHGTSGLDSTLLVTSVAQVILNPDCRTVRGLQALVEREWLQAGHPFHLRHAKSCYSNNRTKSQQPTFLLFIDCIHQLYYQFPCSFEFTTQMLVLLFEHSYFSQFGTFLGNNDAERQAMKIAKKTTSLWSYLNRPDVLTSLLNPLYEPNKTAIWPSVAPVSIVLWSGLYLRWVINQSDNKKSLMKIQNLIDYDKNLKSKALKLRKELMDLQKEYEKLQLDLGENNPDSD